MTFHCPEADSSPTRPMPHPPAEEVGAHPRLEPAEAGAGCELLAQGLPAARAPSPSHSYLSLFAGGGGGGGAGAGADGGGAT